MQGPALAKVVKLPPTAELRVEVRTSPRGEQGIRENMAWMVEQIARDARDPLVIAWGRESVFLAQLPTPRGVQNPRAIVGAVFARLKRESVFVRDPVDTEAIAGPVQVLCLDPDGVCFRGGDCDCLVRTAASVLVGLGIPVRLDLRFYPGLQQAHLMLDYDADPGLKGKWECLDPSVESGVCPAAKYTGQILMEVVMGRMDEPGMFVGMGEAYDPATMGDPPQGSDLSTTDAQAWLAIMATIQAGLSTSAGKLSASLAAYQQIRSDLGLPQFDASAPTTPTGGGEGTPGAGAGPLATYAATKQWTAATLAAEQQLIATAAFIASALADGQSGARALYWNAGDVLLAAKPGDPYRLAMITNAQGQQVIAYLDPTTGNQTGTMGLLPLLIVGSVIAVCTVAVAYAVTKWCDYASATHHDDALMRIADQQQANIAAGTETPAQAQEMLAAATGFANAGPPSTQPVSLSLGGGLALVAVGLGVGVAGAILLPKMLAGFRGGGSRERRTQAEDWPGESGRHRTAAWRGWDRRREGDERVVQNIDPELEPLWRRVGGRFKGTPHERYEAFMQYVHDHPRELAYVEPSDDDYADAQRRAGYEPRRRSTSRGRSTRRRAA